MMNSDPFYKKIPISKEMLDICQIMGYYARRFCRHSSVVELLICNQWVGSSNLSVGTIFNIRKINRFVDFIFLIYFFCIHFPVVIDLPYYLNHRKGRILNFSNPFVHKNLDFCLKINIMSDICICNKSELAQHDIYFIGRR